jgi:acetyl-CoA carboxylase biotin carboxyl carrier protein
MLTYEQIKELIQLVTDNRLHGLEVEKSGFRLKITGFGGGAATAPGREISASPASATALQAEAGPGYAAPSETPASNAPPAPPAAVSQAQHVVTSPIVGTFYSSPSPDADPFVRVGDRVRKGQVLCIVEAMKLMNEIESDVDGVLAEVHPKNAQPVEFGEPLFSVRPD